MKETSSGTPLPWEDELRRQIVPARERKGWTQYELSRRARERGLPYYQATLQRVEAGERPIKLNEAVVLAGILGIDLAGIVKAGSEQAGEQERELERLRGFMAASLEEQSRRYGETVDAARTLFLLQVNADHELESVDPASLVDRDRELVEELRSFVDGGTPWVALLEADSYVRGYEKPGGLAENRGRWREQAEVLQGLRWVIFDEGWVPEDLAGAPAAVRQWFAVVAAAAAELRRALRQIDEGDDLQELASAERAVQLWKGVPGGVDLETQ